MPLIDSNSNPAADEVLARSIEIYKFLEPRVKYIYNVVYNNPKYTPVEIITALGEKAQDLGMLLEDVQVALAHANPKYVPLVPPDINVEPQA